MRKSRSAVGRTFTAKAPASRKASLDDDDLPMQNRISGGSSETEVNEWP